MQTRRIPIAEGVTLTVDVWTGAGAPFVLVHGLASNAMLWRGVARELAAAGHAVATVDQRGHGRSEKPDRGYDFATVTADLCTLIGALGFDRPVVAGQSWGGNVVLELGWRAPELVRGIACVDGGTIELGDRFATWDACRAAMSPPKLEGMQATRLRAAVAASHPGWSVEAIDATMANFEVRADGTLKPWLSLDRHLQILHALWEHRPSRLYPQVKVPVLLMPADTGDAAWTQNKRENIGRAEQALPNSRTVWFAPADHDVHAQHPELVSRTLRAAVVDGFFA